ncbi:hypothetical protein BGX34_008777 [Mortierella sp. NVP85]|nr:hypothetical protein BGX34_008777 [Mortierella sp. NVP85]
MVVTPMDSTTTTDYVDFAMSNAQHEKHRAMRLFQSSTPPCPFCAHGVGPMPGQANASLSAQTSGMDSFKQRTSPLSQLHLPSINQQLQLPQQQRHNKQKPGFQGQEPYDASTFEDAILGYSSNRHSYNTFPFVTSQAVTSKPSESAHGGKTIVTDRGSVDYPGYIFQPQQQGSTSRPPAGAFPQQVPVVSTYAQQQAIHPLVSNPPYMQSNLACVGVTEAHQDNGFATKNRPGITISSTGAVWRENPTENDTQTLLPFAQQPKVTPLRQHQHQKRGSSLQNIFQTSIVSPGHQSHGHGHGLHPKPIALSFSKLPNLPPAAPPTVPRTEAIQWAVVRVTNVPWDISLRDMQSFFSDVPHPPEHLLPQNVHILMDRTTGKTFNSAFIELAVTPQQAGLVVQARHLKMLKGRVVSVELSNQNELMRSVFPKWSGEFIQGDPVIPGEQLMEPRTDSIASGHQGEGFGMNTVEDGDHQDVHEGASNHQTTIGMGSSLCRSNLPLTKGTLSGSSSTNSISAALVRAHPTIPAFVTRDEINALLVVCRNYKLHFSRKCAERPFENIISILVKYPWHQSHRVLPLHRDHIFELLKLSIESLRIHLSKETTTIDPTLLTRIVRSAILSPAFTERQKAMVLHVAGCPCPEDIIGWMTPPVLTENEVVKNVLEDSTQESIDSADGTGEDSQETASEGPAPGEVDTRIENLAVSNEMGTSPVMKLMTKSQPSSEHGRDSHDADDRGMLHSGTGASGIDTPPMDTSSPPHAPSALAAQQASKSSGPPTPSPCTADDDGSQDTDHD